MYVHYAWLHRSSFDPSKSSSSSSTYRNGLMDLHLTSVVEVSLREPHQNHDVNCAGLEICLFSCLLACVYVQMDIGLGKN